MLELPARILLVEDHRVDTARQQHAPQTLLAAGRADQGAEFRILHRPGKIRADQRAGLHPELDPQPRQILQRPDVPAPAIGGADEQAIGHLVVGARKQDVSLALGRPEQVGNDIERSVLKAAQRTGERQRSERRLAAHAAQRLARHVGIHPARAPIRQLGEIGRVLVHPHAHHARAGRGQSRQRPQQNDAQHPQICFPRCSDRPWRKLSAILPARSMNSSAASGGQTSRAVASNNFSQRRKCSRSTGRGAWAAIGRPE